MFTFPLRVRCLWNSRCGLLWNPFSQQLEPIQHTSGCRGAWEDCHLWCTALYAVFFLQNTETSLHIHIPCILHCAHTNFPGSALGGKRKCMHHQHYHYFSFAQATVMHGNIPWNTHVNNTNENGGKNVRAFIASKADWEMPGAKYSPSSLWQSILT